MHEPQERQGASGGMKEKARAMRRNVRGMGVTRALPIAVEAAHAKVPDLDKFVLHSVKPRAIKNDPKGEHWQFLWQELPFKTHLRGIVVRVYMKDGSTNVSEFRD